MRKQVIAISTAAVLALLGIAALVAYANNAQDRALNGTELVEVLRVTEEVPVKTPAGELKAKVRLEKVPRVAVVPGAVDSLDGFDGLVTNSVLVEGDQLTEAKFDQPAAVEGEAAVPKGMQELTIPLSGARIVGGTIKAGDRVGFFSSYPTKTANVINDLLVLRVDAGVSGDDGGGGTLVTVAVKTRDAQKIIHTMEFGKAWMTLQNDDTDTSGGKTSVDTGDVAP